MKEKFMKFMTGRYGIDTLGKFTMGAILACLVLSMVFRRGPWYILGVALLILCYIRMLSKNIWKRQEENQKFLKLTSKFRGWWKKQETYMEQRKTHHIYKCPSCSQKIRIPKGKGKISVRCPKCGREFVKKS